MVVIPISADMLFMFLYSLFIELADVDASKLRFCIGIISLFNVLRKLKNVFGIVVIRKICTHARNTLERSSAIVLCEGRRYRMFFNCPYYLVIRSKIEMVCWLSS